MQGKTSHRRSYDGRQQSTARFLLDQLRRQPGLEQFKIIRL
jgi:hypothetical protein